MRGAEQRLNKLEQQTVPATPCTCKTLAVTQENGREVVRLPACGRHKRQNAVVVMVLKNVSMADL